MFLFLFFVQATHLMIWVRRRMNIVWKLMKSRAIHLLTDRPLCLLFSFWIVASIESILISYWLFIFYFCFKYIIDWLTLKNWLDETNKPWICFSVSIWTVCVSVCVWSLQTNAIRTQFVNIWNEIDECCSGFISGRQSGIAKGKE